MISETQKSKMGMKFKGNKKGIKGNEREWKGMKFNEFHELAVFE